MTRLERECLELLKATLRVKDLIGQGIPVTADALDLCERAENTLLPLTTHMTCGPVFEREQLGVCQ